MATHADDAGLRACLARNAMPGAVSVAFEAEPRFFDALDVQGDTHDVFVAEDDGRIVGFGVRSERSVYLDGAPDRVAYLSGLRLDPEYRSGLLLARGFREWARRPVEAPFALTTIIADNAPARRLLESGRAGLPTYSHLDDLRTHVLVPRRGTGLSSRSARHRLDEAFAFIQRHGSKKQFFPVIDRGDLGTGLLRGVRPEDVRICPDEGGRILAAYLRWDQGSFKQTRIHGYHPLLAAARPVHNALRGLTRQPRLPAVGHCLRYRYVSFPVVRDNDSAILRDVLAAELSSPSLRAYDAALLALCASDPLCAAASAFGGRRYDARVYTVTRGAPPSVVGVPYLEAATL
ncbi:MAG: GNAT family N-acetyltransferase [Gemmatimonadota bacterium]|jgi:hypothetical protein